MSIPRLSINNPVLVNMLMILIIALGLILSLTMVREMFPETTPNRLVVTTVYRGVAPGDMEKAVTVKIEEAIRDLDGIEKIESTINEGASITLVTIAPGVTKVDRLMQDLKHQIDAIEDLPIDAEKTTVRKLEPKLPVISVALYGEGDRAAHKRAARALRDDLLRLPGVYDVKISGILDDEISVDIRPDKLYEYDISFDEVARVIRETNLDLSGGQLEGPRSLVTVRTLGEKQRGADLTSLVVRSLPDGRQITLSDIADIRDAFIESDLEAYYNGEPAKFCVVYKAPNQDAIRISQVVKAYIKGKQQVSFDAWGLDAAAAQPWYYRPIAIAQAHFVRMMSSFLSLPDPQAIYDRSRNEPFSHSFKVDLHTDLARFIEGRIALMVDNGFQGLVLMLVALVMFLNWRVAFWAAAGIPVTFLGTFVLMWVFGVSFNMISLMGLIIVLSIDVDEAIVMSENVYRYLEEGLNPHEAALKGAEEMMWPIIVMTGTTIGAFFPLMFLSGRLGDFLKQLPMVCAAAMTVSMIEALIILPAHLAELPAIKPKAEPELSPVQRGWFSRAWRAVYGGYEWVLWFLVDICYDRFIRFSLKHRYLTLSAALASLMVVMGMWAGGVVETVYVQKMDSETVVANLEMPLGTPASTTRERLKILSAAAVQVPEVVNVQMFVAVQVSVAGEGAVGEARSPHLGQLIIELKESTQRNRTSEQIVAELRKVSERLPGTNAVTWLSLQGGPAGRSVEIRLSGENFEESLSVAERVREKLATFRGVFDIDDDSSKGLREVQIALRESARATGITVATLAQEVRNAFFGREAKRINRDREDVKIMVRYPKHYRRDVFSLEAMWIPTSFGPDRKGWVPIKEVAQLTEGLGYNTIHRVAHQRSVTVFADVDEQNGNDSEIVQAIRKWYVDELQAEFSAVRMEVQGKTLETSKMMNSLKVAFPISLLIIYMLLAGLFRSYVQPLVVMIAVPFGIQGAILGHWIMGAQITIMSMIGLVALNGIVDNDSLVLVDFINTRVRSGMSEYEASVEGSKLRLRAIVLTTVTTTFGMFPLMLETSFQAKFLIPMAITLCFGLMFATVLTLVVVPAINMVFFDIRRLFGSAEQAATDPHASSAKTTS